MSYNYAGKTWDDLLYKSMDGTYKIGATAARNGATIEGATKAFGALPAKYAGQVSGYNPNLVNTDPLLAHNLGLTNSSGTGTASQPTNNTSTTTDASTAARIKELEAERDALTKTSNAMGGLPTNLARIEQINKELNQHIQAPGAFGSAAGPAAPWGTVGATYGAFGGQTATGAAPTQPGSNPYDYGENLDQMYGAVFNSDREFATAEEQIAKMTAEQKVMAQRMMAVGIATAAIPGLIMSGLGPAALLNPAAYGGVAAGGVAAAIPATGSVVMPGAAAGTLGTAAAGGAAAGGAGAAAGGAAVGGAGAGGLGNLTVPALTAASGIAGGLVTNNAANTQANAATEAAQIQADAANKATTLQESIYNQTRHDLAPWRAAGEEALGYTQDAAGNWVTRPSGGLRTFDQDNPEYSVDPFKFDQDPMAQQAYNFRLGEGLKALQSSAAAKGMLRSGNTLQAITNYGQGMASQEYDNAFNRYQANTTNEFNRHQSQRGAKLNAMQSLAGVGQSAVNQTGNAAQNYATGAGQYGMAGANALAGGRTGAADARASGWVGATQTGMNALGMALNYNNQNNLINAFAQRGY